MCRKPLTINNRSVHYIAGIHKASYEVPCGKCDQCRDSRRYNYMTRLSFAFAETLKLLGHVLFLTFTYNDAHLPMVHYKGRSCPCFSTADTLQLIRALRRYYEKKGLKFKYFLVSEYGKTTRRPHYHVLFFIPPQIDHVTFAEKARKYWTHMYVADKDIYTNNGFMFPSKSDVKRGRHLCRSTAGLSFYAAKYTTKDLDFFELPLIKEIYENKTDRDTYKHIFPHMRIAHHLGTRSILEYLAEHPDATQITNPCTGQLVNIPVMVIDKMAYNFVKSDRISVKTGLPITERFLNDFGLKRRLALLPKLIEKQVDNYKSLNLGYTDAELFRVSVYHYVYKGHPANAVSDFFWTAPNFQLFEHQQYTTFYCRTLLTKYTDLYCVCDEQLAANVTATYHIPRSVSVTDYLLAHVAIAERILEDALQQRRNEDSDYRAEVQRISDAIRDAQKPDRDKQIGDEDCVWCEP